MVIGLVRVSTDRQEFDQQKNTILNVANDKKIMVDEWRELVMSGKRDAASRRKQAIMAAVDGADTIVLSELSRLTRGGTGETFSLLHEIGERGIRIISAAPALDLNPNADDRQEKLMATMLIFAFSIGAQIEADMISERTKSALAARKAKGLPLGKPKGTVQKSMFDPHRQTIEELVSVGLSAEKVAKAIGIGTGQGVRQYCRKHEIKYKGRG